jgi:hypothetical protein
MVQDIRVRHKPTRQHTHTQRIAYGRSSALDGNLYAPADLARLRLACDQVAPCVGTFIDDV